MSCPCHQTVNDFVIKKKKTQKTGGSCTVACACASKERTCYKWEGKQTNKQRNKPCLTCTHSLLMERVPLGDCQKCYTIIFKCPSFWYDKLEHNNLFTITGLVCLFVCLFVCFFVCIFAFVFFLLFGFFFSLLFVQANVCRTGHSFSATAASLTLLSWRSPAQSQNRVYWLSTYLTTPVVRWWPRVR